MNQSDHDLWISLLFASTGHALRSYELEKVSFGKNAYRTVHRSVLRSCQLSLIKGALTLRLFFSSSTSTDQLHILNIHQSISTN